MSSKLFIHTLGAFQIHRNGEDISQQFSQKGRALLVCLAYTQHTHERSSLFNLVMKPHQPLSSFRREISRLRKVLDDDVIIAESIGIRPGLQYWMDALVVETEMTHLQHVPAKNLSVAQVNDLEQMLKLYRGDFLSSLVIDNLNFEIWQTMTRQSLVYSVIIALDKLIDYYTERENYHLALGNARHLVEVDPTRSASYRRLMELLALTDQRTAALQVFERCSERLQKELNVQPSALTLALYKKIRYLHIALCPISTPGSPDHNL
jgi:DNA-binding SARP family transcriptional activator